MKFWFTKKGPKDVYDVKAPYDATVEQALRVAQEVNATPVDADSGVFDFARALRSEPQQENARERLPAIPAISRPTVSHAAREEMERRTANYRAFQIKLNDEREARIRRTMDTVRAQLKKAAAQDPSPR